MNPDLLNTADGHSVVKQALQTRNSGEVVVVYNVLDDTEGLVPFDKFFNTSLRGYRNFDVGGGRFNTATEYLKNSFGVTNLVYDPYNRSEKHNRVVLDEVYTNPVDTVTSFSVLNVILDERERKAHLRLVHHALRKNGLAFFTIWRGNGSGIASRCQLNRDAGSHLVEIVDVFGLENVALVVDDIGNSIIAKK